MAKTSGGNRASGATRVVFKNEIKQMYSVYEEAKLIAKSRYKEEIKKLSSITLTPRQRETLSKNIEFYKSNPLHGTKKNLDKYIDDNIKKIQSGSFKRSLMKVEGTNVDILHGFGREAAYREIIPEIEKLLSKN